MRKIISLLFVLMTSFHSVAQDTTITAYFPAVQGWNETSREIYLGEDLFFLINGGAEVYLEYGFDQVLAVDLRNADGLEASVEIYKMEDETSAYGIWSFNAKQGEDSGIGVNSFRGNDYLMFRKGDAYVIVRAGEANDIDVIERLSENLAKAIPAGGEIQAWLMPFVGIDQYRTVLVEGNVALNNFYYFGYENIFKVSQALVLEREGSKFILVKYSDENIRESALDQAASFMKGSGKFEVHKAENSFSDRKENILHLTSYNEYLIISISKEDINKESGKIIQLIGSGE